MDKEAMLTWWHALTGSAPWSANFEPPVLLSADADRVSDYVFETPGLPEMRGASAQLTRLNDIKEIWQAAGIPEELCIYAGGGSVVALLPASIADRIAQQIARRYPQETGAATVTCVTLPVTPTDVRQHFGELVRTAGERLRAAKGQKELLPFFETLPFVRRCDACRKRPATTFLEYENQPSEARCRVCADKGQRGKALRTQWHIELGVEYPQDLETIGKAANGSIGIIYADANGLGDWIQAADTLAEFKRRSSGVKKAVNEALLEALRTKCAGLPFEVILVGGDDVLLITPASVALDVAASLCEQFAAAMGDEQKTMSAGVVIADHHTPVYFLRRLAEQLLKQTKRQQPGVGAVDFLVLKSQGTRSLAEAWETFSFETPKETLTLHHGPYTLTDLKVLLEQVRAGKEINYPRSQLYGLRDTFKQGRQASALAFLYQQARSTVEVKEFLRQVAAYWSVQDLETPPWFEARRLPAGRVEYRTVWADLADVWDWIV